MTKARCMDCRFWQISESKDEEGGECRIRAPQIISAHLREGGPTDSNWPLTMAFWPNTGEEDWCGEFVEA